MLPRDFFDNDLSNLASENRSRLLKIAKAQREGNLVLADDIAAGEPPRPVDVHTALVEEDDRTIEMSRPQAREVRGVVRPNLVLDEEYNLYGRVARERSVYTPSFVPRELDDDEYFRMHGKHKPGPKITRVRLGRFLLDAEKLARGTFSARYVDSVDKPRFFPNRHLSPQAVEAITALVEGQDVDVSVLPLPEQIFLTRLHKAAALPIQSRPSLSGTGLSKTVNGALKRFDVLLGMVLSGNDSREILIELSSLVNTLARTGAITSDRARQVSELVERSLM